MMWNHSSIQFFLIKEWDREMDQMRELESEGCILYYVSARAYIYIYIYMI